MCRPRGMADFTARVATGGVDKPPQLYIEARVASRSSERIVRMALLARGQVGLGCRTVVDRFSPAEWVPHLPMAESAVHAARFARGEGGDNRCPQVIARGVANGTDGGV